MEQNVKNKLLHSQEVEAILGKVPPVIVRWGSLVIALVVCLLIALSYWVQYPEKVTGTVQIPLHQDSICTVCIRPEQTGKVSTGMPVIIRIRNYPEDKFGHLNGSVSHLIATPEPNGLYTVEVRLKDGLTTSYGKKLTTSLQLVGSGEVVVRKYRLLERLIPLNLHQ